MVNDSSNHPLVDLPLGNTFSVANKETRVTFFKAVIYSAEKPRRTEWWDGRGARDTAEMRLQVLLSDGSKPLPG